MTRIGLISDTHAHFDSRFYELFKDVDVIWHAGDIGSIDVYDTLCNFKPTIAVVGNIDGQPLRSHIPESKRFMCENVDVWLTHIGGYPGKYPKQIKQELDTKPPKLFICGHSHILKVIYDKKYDLLHLNPGAAGISGFHQIRTALRFCIDGESIKEMEIIELGKRT
jgi:uncharacterized protein